MSHCGKLLLYRFEGTDFYKQVHKVMFDYKHQANNFPFGMFYDDS